MSNKQSPQQSNNGSITYPRVLIVSPIRLNTKTGGGVAMSGFFHDWPMGTLAQVYSSISIKPETHICQKYFHVINMKMPQYLRDHIGTFPYYAERLRYFMVWLIYHLLLPELKLVFKRSIEQITGRQNLTLIERIIVKFDITLEQDILSWCRDFNPDVIYCQITDKPNIYWWLPFHLSQVLEIPLVTHIMDDWPTKLEKKTGFWHRNFTLPLMRSSLQTLLSNSVQNLSICESMSVAFKKRYGVTFTVFQHAIDIDEWLMVEQSSSSTGAQEFKIIYLGKILPHMQLDSLHDIGTIVKRLRQSGTQITLCIYGPQYLTGRYSQSLIAPPAITYEGFVPREKLAQTLADADLLVIPVNFDENSVSYVRYSIPAKTPEYMASGSAILVYGPEGTPPVSYAQSAGWGYVVTQRDLSQLEDAIIALIEDPKLRQSLGQRARKLAFENHNAQDVRRRFLRLLQSVAE